MTSQHRTRALIALTAAILLLTACTSPESRSQPNLAAATDIATGLDVPWGIAFLPDGSALVAERSTGAINHLTAPGELRPVGNVDGVVPRAEGGLLGLATGGSDVFAYLGTGQDNRVVRTGFDGAALTRQAPILTGIPVAAIHNGGRIAFGPDGKLYVATGEASEPSLAQDRSSLGGKILRINPDGSIPADNPDPASPIWSIGHRNVQGLAWDSTGRMWATEYGANRLDELNLIQPGGNYGWPTAEGRAGIEGLTDPMLQWPVEQASPSGLAYYGGALWVAALRGERLLRVPVGADGALGAPESLFVGQYGRLRTVVAAPDGSLWFTSSNRDGRGDPREGDDRILQYRP